MPRTVLRLDSSARTTGSVTRDLADKVIADLNPDHVITRDLSKGVDLITEAWVGANFTPAADRSDAQTAELAQSDSLIAEIQEADTLVIGLPIYNFGVPAAFKAWVDQIARAGVTFRYTETGPVGLLQGKRAIVIVASGGVEAGSAVDFATDFTRHVLGFVGITDVDVIAADRLMVDADAALKKAHSAIEALLEPA